MIRALKEVTYPVSRADSMSDEERKGKLALGRLVCDDTQQDYSTKSDALRNLACKEEN